MSGISATTALEINNHPGDIQVSIYKVKEGDWKYGIIVCRGPGHSYKLLISTSPFADTVEQAVEEVKNLLTGIHSWATKELSDIGNPITQILNPSGCVDVSQTLNPDLINKILNGLRQHQVADTHHMITTTR